MEDFSENTKQNIRSTFKAMLPTPAKATVQLYKEWMKKRSEMVFDPKKNDILIKDIVERSFGVAKNWFTCPISTISQTLHKVAKALKKYEDLLSEVTCMASERHLWKVKSRDIPHLIENFKYHAGYTTWLNNLNIVSGPVLIVCSENLDLFLTLMWKVGAALALRYPVLVVGPIKSCLPFFLLAEIFDECGIPSGIFNVFPIPNDYEVQDCGFSKIFYAGPLEKLNNLPLPYEAIVCRKSVVLVYENADLYSAAESVFENLSTFSTRGPHSGCKVLVQESIFKKFLEILKHRLSRLMVGDHLSRTDMTCGVSKQQKDILSSFIDEAMREKCEIYYGPEVPEEEQLQMRPVLISGVQTLSKIAYNEVGGPIIVALPFRTVKESIAMFNCDNKGSPVCIWTEQMSLALEVAYALKTGNIWLNSENIYCPSVSYTGVYLSGNAIGGGSDASLSLLGGCYLESCAKVFPEETSCFELAQPYTVEIGEKNIIEFKNYIGGCGKKSTNKALMYESNIVIPDGSQSDLLTAVSSAASAQPVWEKFSIERRSEILLSLYEHFKEKKQSFIDDLTKSYKSSEACIEDIQTALNMFWFWAVNTHSSSGHFEVNSSTVSILQKRESLGVIGIEIHGCKPLTCFVANIAPALLLGNAVIAIVPEDHPVPCLKVCEIFTASNFPKGVINVLCGRRRNLVLPLLQHPDVNSVWLSYRPSWSDVKFSATVRLFYPEMDYRESPTEHQVKRLVLESTYNKLIYSRSGHIFAN